MLRTLADGPADGGVGLAKEDGVRRLGRSPHFVRDDKGCAG